MMNTRKDNMAKWLMEYIPKGEEDILTRMYANVKTQGVRLGSRDLLNHADCNSWLPNIPMGQPFTARAYYAPPVRGKFSEPVHTFSIPNFKDSYQDALFKMSTSLFTNLDFLLNILDAFPREDEALKQMADRLSRCLVIGSSFSERINSRLTYLEGVFKSGVRMVVFTLEGEVYFLPEGRHPIFTKDQVGSFSEIEAPSYTGSIFLSKKNFQKGKLVKVLRKVLETSQELKKVYFLQESEKVKEGLDILSDDRFVEKLNNLYMSYFVNLGDFQVDKGEEIRRAYSEVNFDRDFNLGTMRNSCMRHSFDDDYCGDEYSRNEEEAAWLALEFYARNSSVSLLTLRNPDNGKVRGRALLWDVEAVSEGWERRQFKFLDRVYGNDIVRYIFKKYAVSQGWTYKVRDDSRSDFDLGLPPDLMQFAEGGKNSAKGVELTCRVEDFTDLMPYCDSLSHSDRCDRVGNGKFSGYDMLQTVPYDQSGFDRGVYLESRDDYYPEDETCYSEYTGRDEHVDDVVWSDYQSSYIPTDDTVYVEDVDDYYPQDSADYGTCNDDHLYYSYDSLNTCEHDDYIYRVDVLVGVYVDGDRVLVYEGNLDAFVEELYPAGGEGHNYYSEAPVEE